MDFFFLHFYFENYSMNKIVSISITEFLDAPYISCPLALQGRFLHPIILSSEQGRERGGAPRQPLLLCPGHSGGGGRVGHRKKRRERRGTEAWSPAGSLAWSPLTASSCFHTHRTSCLGSGVWLSPPPAHQTRDLVRASDPLISTSLLSLNTAWFPPFICSCFHLSREPLPGSVTGPCPRAGTRGRVSTRHWSTFHALAAEPGRRDTGGVSAPLRTGLRATSASCGLRLREPTRV